MGLIALITGTGNANCTRLRLVQFHTLPVPVMSAINPHIALSTVLLTIHILLSIIMNSTVESAIWGLISQVTGLVRREIARGEAECYLHYQC